MTSIYIAYRDRSDSIADVIHAADELPPAERRVARQVALAALQAGLSNAGALLDRLDQLTPAQRRVLAGIPDPPAAPVQPVNDQLPRDEAGCAYQSCSATGCRTYPTDPHTGAPQPTNARRWWCEQHRAGHEQDMQPWTSSIRFAPGGSLEFATEVEAETERLRVDAARRAAARATARAAAQEALPARTAEQEAEQRAWRPANMIGDTW